MKVTIGAQNLVQSFMSLPGLRPGVTFIWICIPKSSLYCYPCGNHQFHWLCDVPRLPLGIVIVFACVLRRTLLEFSDGDRAWISKYTRSDDSDGLTTGDTVAPRVSWGTDRDGFIIQSSPDGCVSLSVSLVEY